MTTTTELKVTAVFKKVATFNIDSASRDSNRTHQNAFRSCDSTANFILVGTFSLHEHDVKYVSVTCRW